jgi:hypothetical protein
MNYIGFVVDIGFKNHDSQVSEDGSKGLYTRLGQHLIAMVVPSHTVAHLSSHRVSIANPILSNIVFHGVQDGVGLQVQSPLEDIFQLIVRGGNGGSSGGQQSDLVPLCLETVQLRQAGSLVVAAAGV